MKSKKKAVLKLELSQDYSNLYQSYFNNSVDFGVFRYKSSTKKYKDINDFVDCREELQADIENYIEWYDINDFIKGKHEDIYLGIRTSNDNFKQKDFVLKLLQYVGNKLSLSTEFEFKNTNEKHIKLLVCPRVWFTSPVLVSIVCLLVRAGLLYEPKKSAANFFNDVLKRLHKDADIYNDDYEEERNDDSFLESLNTKLKKLSEKKLTGLKLVKKLRTLADKHSHSYGIDDLNISKLK